LRDKRRGGDIETPPPGNAPFWFQRTDRISLVAIAEVYHVFALWFLMGPTG
jgi:hypothetical protein